LVVNRKQNYDKPSDEETKESTKKYISEAKKYFEVSNLLF